jgi:DNA-binding XRE family transcriptional regulator
VPTLPPINSLARIVTANLSIVQDLLLFFNVGILAKCYNMLIKRLPAMEQWPTDPHAPAMEHETPEPIMWYPGNARDVLRYLDTLLLERGIDLGTHIPPSRRLYFLPLLDPVLSLVGIAEEIEQTKARPASEESVRKISIMIVGDAVAVAKWYLPEHEQHLIPQRTLSKNPPAPDSARYAIIQLRKHAGLTQQELGARLGVSRGKVSRLEVGAQTMPHDLVAKLCRELGTTETEATRIALQYTLENGL